MVILRTEDGEQDDFPSSFERNGTSDAYPNRTRKKKIYGFVTHLIAELFASRA